VVDGITLSNGAAIPLANLFAGATTFKVNAADVAGNTSSLSVIFKVGIDIGVSIVNPLFAGLKEVARRAGFVVAAPTRDSRRTALRPPNTLAVLRSRPALQSNGLWGSGFIRQLTPKTWVAGSTYYLDLWAGLPKTEPDGSTPISAWPQTFGGRLGVFHDG